MVLATVDQYLDSIPEALRPVGAQMRPLIDAGLPKAQGVIWHGQPVWMIGKTPVALLKAYPKYVTFGLFRGQAVNDPSGRLEANSREMASVKLKAEEDIDAPLFEDWLRQVQALEVQ